MLCLCFYCKLQKVIKYTVNTALEQHAFLISSSTNHMDVNSKSLTVSFISSRHQM